MAMRLDRRAADFDTRFAALLAAKREAAEDVDATAKAIIDDVRARGDEALIDYTRRFDRLDLTPATIRVSQSEIDRAESSVDEAARQALYFARDRIEAFHRRQLPTDDWSKDAAGVELGWRWTAVASAGLYVPGGTAAYPSSVLMNAIPARVAGVERLAMTVPAPDGKLNPLVITAAVIAGVDEIYRVGGAQAIAALAYGTRVIAPVTKIVGPGNAYVAAAKRRVFGTVGIDMIAGPSEVVVVAGRANDPAWIAADLLAQAEHDVSAQSILITDSEAFANAVEAAIETMLQDLPRRDIAAASWRDHGAIILVSKLTEAPRIVDRIAPEHLELAVDAPEAMLGEIRNAGAVFLGRHTPEAIGDYVGGPNHVLPTARSARFASGLSVTDFMKRTTLLRCDAAALQALGPAAVTLAKAEGLEAHARSVAIRGNF